jgi:uncharacterized protein
MRKPKSRNPDGYGRFLFAHWRVDADGLRGVIPRQLPFDLYDGEAWVGLTPFRVEGFRLRRTLPPPVLPGSSR